MLACNRVTLPAHIGEISVVCPALRFLDLSKNKLTALPEGWHHCTDLQWIVLSHNLLCEKQIDKLMQAPALESLVADHNKATKLPSLRDGFTKLQFFSLTHNHLSSFAALSPLWLPDRRLQLQVLAVWGNPNMGFMEPDEDASLKILLRDDGKFTMIPPENPVQMLHEQPSVVRRHHSLSHSSPQPLESLRPYDDPKAPSHIPKLQLPLLFRSVSSLAGPSTAPTRSFNIRHGRRKQRSTTKRWELDVRQNIAVGERLARRRRETEQKPNAKTGACTTRVASCEVFITEMEW